MTIRRPPLDLRELLTVRIIARAGSIHGAARMMGGKQSAISRSLRLLEERLGVPSSAGPLEAPGSHRQERRFCKRQNCSLMEQQRFMNGHDVGAMAITGSSRWVCKAVSRRAGFRTCWSHTPSWRREFPFVWRDATRQDLLLALKDEYD
ncbi:LysR family transcriptional regulator [Komagataeibacter rhaeticus]|nr:LysR family transcriptional regulator [Komagataeibacter rhaeticus]